MSSWLNALMLAILVVTVPFAMILRILLQLPKAHALSNRRWPSVLNVALVGGITALVTIFIRNAYFVKRHEPALILLQFMIAALVYGFGLALILRQYSGIYPEFLVTTGIAGLGIRKIAYRNVDDVEEVWRGRGETRLRIHTVSGTDFVFTLPTRSVPILHERLQAAQPPE